jgi:hypothetical protein
VTTARRSGVTLLLAFFVSTVGDWIYRLAIPTLILAITGSALATAVAYMLEFLPYIVIGLVSGVVADRMNRRLLMVACDSTSCVLALGIAGLTLLRHPPIAALYAAAFALACVRPFYFPAFQGFVVDAVPEKRLAAVNSWTQTADSLLSFVGPVLGTVVIAAIGTTSATVANAASFALSALLVLSITYRRKRPDTIAPNSVREDFIAGLRTLWSLRPVLVGTVLMALANLSAFAVEGSLFSAHRPLPHRVVAVLGNGFLRVRHADPGRGANLGRYHCRLGT